MAPLIDCSAAVRVSKGTVSIPAYLPTPTAESRCNNTMDVWYFKRDKFVAAEKYFRSGIAKAQFGLGRKAAPKKMLSAVLRRDPDHAPEGNFRNF